MPEIQILPYRISSTKSTKPVITLLGVKAMIERGAADLIEGQTLTPRAAEYWAQIQKRADKL